MKRVPPKDLNKKKIVIQTLTQSVGILPKASHQRVSRKLSTKIKDTVVLFYCRDDISYQMPGKRDTIAVKNSYSRTTYQKRILLYTIREAYEIFLVENPGNASFVVICNLFIFFKVFPFLELFLLKCVLNILWLNHAWHIVYACVCTMKMSIYF